MEIYVFYIHLILCLSQRYNHLKYSPCCFSSFSLVRDLILYLKSLSVIHIMFDSR